MAAPVEHIVTITGEDRQRLLEWLAAPDGSLTLSTPRVEFSAVEGGSVMIRTTPWKPGGKA